MESDVSPELLHKCNGCKARFINELLRIQHVRHLHPELLPFTCDLCGIKCETNAAISRHIHNKHRKTRKPRVPKLPAGCTEKPPTPSLKIKESKSSGMQQIGKTLPEVSPQWRARVEMACVRYAMIHGKHKAQLRYAELEPDCRIGWRRLTELLSKYKNDETSKKHRSALYLYKKGRKPGMTNIMLTVPPDIKSDCGKYAVTQGLDEAQWQFTIKYPNYIFSYASVRNWCEAERMKLELETGKHQQFDEAFVASLNVALIETKSITISEVGNMIKDHVDSYNKNRGEDKFISAENVTEEWLHMINAQAAEKKKATLAHCACGNAYKTEKELAKHKPKCWVPDFKSEDQVRSQRSCRVKATPSECETISDSDTESSSVVEETVTNAYQCTDCDYSTPQEFRYKRHAKACNKKKQLSERQSSNKARLESYQSNNDPELFTFKSCKRCTFKHISIEGLREHYRVVHNTHYTDNGQEISLLCSKCNDTFLTYAGLREHICGERQVTVEYERIKPRIPSSIMLGTNSSVVFLCPRCVTRFDTILELQEHYTAKTCPKVKLYA